jgi:hypothetical protein
VTSSNFQQGFRLLVSDERSLPSKESSTFERQPFLQNASTSPLDRFITDLTREQGVWQDTLSKEQTAYALAQVSASNVLPPLVEMHTGYAMLEYKVELRGHIDSLLVTELARVLHLHGQDLHWGKVEADVFAAVIGAGVAACIDTTPGREFLNLRYANALEMEFSTTRHAAELSRSALFLQSALHERFDAVLERVRARIWHWLID